MNYAMNGSCGLILSWITFGLRAEIYSFVNLIRPGLFQAVWAWSKGGTENAEGWGTVGVVPMASNSKTIQVN